MKKTTGVAKGAPSGFVISLGIHAAAILLAGMLVVFNVVQKEEKKFVPPKPVDRPKMKLKKPKVKVKKSSKPKATARIVTKVKRASMPDIQLPEMAGMMDGIAGGVGGFEIMPGQETGNLFGESVTVGNDFVGTFYDFKRNRSGRSIPMAPDTMMQEIKNFIISGWKPAKLARFYRSPKKLYTTFFCIPTVQSILGPTCFGENDTGGWCWMAHYKGQLVYPEDITFRFWGNGDDIMLVRVDGKLALNACWPTSAEPVFASLWSSSSSDSRKHPLGNQRSVVGDWITLKAGEPLDMEVLIGEGPGGLFESLLAVEVQGVDYPKNEIYLGPKLPIFKTEALTRDQIEAVHEKLYPTDASVTEGPVFKDYFAKSSDTPDAAALEPVPVVEPAPQESTALRIWTALSGKTLEAEYVTLMGREVVVKSKRGKQIKLPLSQLCPEDIEFVALKNPPKYDIDFTKTSVMIPPPVMTPHLDQDPRPLRMQDYTFGVRLRQMNNVKYEHELTVEYFAIADEVDGDNRILVERNEGTFIPFETEKGTFIMTGEPTRITSQALRATAPIRGAKYGGFLIVISDKTGDIVQYKASHENLMDMVDILRTFPIGKHFNKVGERVDPPRPTEGDRPTWNW
ncbi:hypothetical protein P4B35_15285 [Pontiellaceae bacterium B12227]|nr:hypothetical protein [Pontiellaceae bacterium B12227]